MMDPTSNAPPMQVRSTQGGVTRAGGARRAPAPDPRLVEDPFFYGYRWKRVKTPDGKTVSEQVPLTRADLLDPQEDDHVSNHLWHELITSKLGEILRALFARRERGDVLVCGNMKMLWKDRRIKRVDPDIAVIPGVRDLGRDLRSFDEAKEGTRPLFVLEVTSEATQESDRDDKPAVYEQAKVDEYFILDQLQVPWKIVARRLDPMTGKYRKSPPAGRAVAQTLEVVFEVGKDGMSLDLTDQRTGERLLDVFAADEARRAEAEARRAAEERARALEEEVRLLRAKLAGDD